MPNAKGKKKGNPKPKLNSSSGTVPKQCHTLEEDEETRCTLPATHGYPLGRCKVHHGQYCTMTKRYKDASKIVDEVRGRLDIPTMAIIARYKDVQMALKKARWMRRYVEAIRVEKTGREIHHRRFFAKADDGHKIRLKVLARQMVEAIEVLDAVQARAFDLHIVNHPGYEWVKEFQTTALPTSASDELDNISTTEEPKSQSGANPARSGSAEPEPEGTQDDDLIEMEIRAEKTKYLHVFEFLLDPEALSRFVRAETQNIETSDSQSPYVDRRSTIAYNTMLQYARRILFHDPVLSLKALDKVSFKDLILDPDFSLEDGMKFFELWNKRLGIGLLWLKDATVEALVMSTHSGKPGTGNAANVGKPQDRFPMVGGWIYNRPHQRTTSNEVWWHLVNTLELPANIENRFVRLCHNFDDLHSLLSFGALGMMPAPSFCRDSNPTLDAGLRALRNHLSLSGVLVTDMVSPSPLTQSHSGPFPTRKPAKKQGCILWGELESRAYMFGAIRNEPDKSTTAFLNELRARPDLFYVVTRSDTDPGRKVEAFGDASLEPFAQIRYRNFEAPPAESDNRPRGRGEWSTGRSAIDVLYGTQSDSLGYLTALDRPGSSGWFFHFKKFPVKYFVIFDAKPNNHVHSLGKEVAWAALRAQGLAKGEYSVKAYARASDVLFQKHAEERLAWMPEEYGGWHATKMDKEEYIPSAVEQVLPFFQGLWKAWTRFTGTPQV